jgi:transposase
MSRPIGTPAELERRRRHAVELMERGESPTTVARILGVARPSLYRWRKAARSQPDGLAAKPHPGPAPGLRDDQLEHLEDLLLDGPGAHGWPTELWTAKRVAEVIRRHFGLSYHPEHVRKILKGRLHWSSQKPQDRATQRDDEEVVRWLEEEFPRILAEARQRHAHVVFLDESGFMLLPLLRRTLWPRGVTPILPVSGKRDRISAISCITLSPKRYLPGLYFELLPDNVNVTGEHVVAFLRELKKALPRFTVVWDQNNIHGKARLVKAFLAANPSIVAEDFPGYVPELNPDEGVWGYTKYGRLANFAPADAKELRERVDAELRALKRQAYFLYSFIRHTELPLQL